MNIAELKGEKTVKTLAKRLLAEPSNKTKKTTNAEMEAALLRLNPQLSQIGDLEKGTPILVPDEFVLAAEESFTPSRSLAEELLRQSEGAVSRLQAVLQERVARSAEESDRVGVLRRSVVEIGDAVWSAERAAARRRRESRRQHGGQRRSLNRSHPSLLPLTRCYQRRASGVRDRSPPREHPVRFQ